MLKRSSAYLKPSETADTFTTTGTGIWVPLSGRKVAVQADLNSGGVSATVEIHLSLNDSTVPGNGTLAMTLTCSGSRDPAFGEFETSALFACAKVTALNGIVDVRINAEN